METDGNKRNKKGCFLDDFRFRLHIYTSLGTEASCTSTAREKSMAEESSSQTSTSLSQKKSTIFFCWEKSCEKSYLDFPATYNLVWSRSVRISSSSSSSPQRSSTHVNTSFVRKEQSAGLKKKLKASNIIFDLGLNKFRNTTQLVCADKNVSSLSRYTKR